MQGYVCDYGDDEATMIHKETGELVCADQAKDDCRGICPVKEVYAPLTEATLKKYGRDESDTL